MLNWQLWSGTKDAWDKALLSSDDYTVFQTFSWGEHKKTFGWVPRRYFIVDKNNKILGMAQVLIKKMPLGLVFIWSSGGVVFNFPGCNLGEVADLINRLIGKLREVYPRSLIRFNSQVESDSMLTYEFNKVSSRPYVKLNSGFSIQFKLNQSIEQIRKGMASKHRYYSKKASSTELTWIVGNDDQQLTIFAKNHRAMLNDKQLALKGIDLIELQNMRDNLGFSMQFLTGYLNDIPVTSCLFLLCGRKAFYMAAFTCKLGREIGASYAMFERLMQELIDRDINFFDFGGIDPVNASANGVNHFKCGFGGKLVEYLGEWESASSEKIRLAINLAIKFRVGRK